LESAGNVIFCKENDSLHMRGMVSKVAKAMKHNGALAIAQLSHAGRQTPRLVNPHPSSCSDVQLKVPQHIVGFGRPIPLTEQQVKTEVVDRFVFAAKLARDCGFDGVQLHGAHGYLLSSFMSPATNNRTDKYGGSAQNRMRVIREIFEEIRKEISAVTGFLVGIKMNTIELNEKGLNVEEAKVLCGIIESIGFDFVELSGGTLERNAFIHKTDLDQKREAFFISFAEKGMVNAIQEGATDGIGLGRPITAEPDLPAKFFRKECFSTADSKLNQNDFFMTLLASQAQMGQMGKKPFAEQNSICEGIADLSHPDEAMNFKEAAILHVNKLKETAKRNEPFHGRIHSRIPASHVDVGILGQPLTFRSGRTAQNRFLKAALTERISTWDAKDPSKRGVPTQELINLYDKWGHGKFGVTLTGNVCVEPVRFDFSLPAICQDSV
uniref:Oxidored_FMN domain-containing protein n=1 Tax=Haemonchus placei TaxID=6290 RepID=A0A0N4X7J0_HAEPC